MFKKIICIFLFFSVITFAEVKPSVMLEQLANNLLTQISSKNNDQSDVANVIKKVLIPKIDKEYMAMSVIGRNYWLDASENDKKDFIDQFEIMVTNNYARLFANYTDQKVVFMPYRGDYSDKSRIEIKSQVTASSKNNFKVSYKLLKDKSANWMIYDFSIDGISMVESYKSQFSPVLDKSGLTGLIDNIKKFNSK